MPLFALTTACTGCAPKPIKDLTVEPKLLTAEQKVALIMDVFLAALATTIVVLIILASNGVPLGPMNALSTVGFWGAVAITAFALTIVITDAIMLMVMQAKLTTYLQKVREKLVDDNDAHARAHADEIERLQESNTALQERIEELEGQDKDVLIAENRGLKGRVVELDERAQRFYEEVQRLRKAEGENEAAFEERAERMHQRHTEEIEMLRKEHTAELERLRRAIPLATPSVNLEARERELQEQHAKQVEELNNNFRERLDKLNRENQEEVEELRKQASEREQVQVGLFREMQEELSGQLNEAQERAGRLEAKINHLEGELRQRQERVEALQLEKGGEEEAHRISEATQRELEGLKRQVAEAKEELTRVQEEAGEAREALEALTAQQEAKREEMGRLEQSIEEKTRALGELEEQHKGKNALIRGLGEVIEAKTRESEGLNEQVGAITKDIAAKKEEAEQLAKQLENLTKESEDKAGQSAQLSERHRELTEKLEGLEQGIREKTRQSGELAVSHGKLQEEMKELKAQKEKVEAACEEASLQLEQKQGELANALFEAIGQQKQVVSFVEGKIAQLKVAISSGEDEESEGVEANQEELAELLFTQQSYSSLIENNTAKLRELGHEVKDEEAVDLGGSAWVDVGASDSADKKEKEAETDSKMPELLGVGDESQPHPLHDEFVKQGEKAAAGFDWEGLDSKLSAAREKQQETAPTPSQAGDAEEPELPPLLESEGQDDWNESWGLSGDTPLRGIEELAKQLAKAKPIPLDLGNTSTASQKPGEKEDNDLGDLDKLEDILHAEIKKDEEGSDGTTTPPPQSPAKTERQYPPTPLPPPEKASANFRFSKSDFSGGLFDDPTSEGEKSEPSANQDAAPPVTRSLRQSTASAPTPEKSVQGEDSTEAKDSLASGEEEKAETPAPSTPTKSHVAETKEGPSPGPAGKPAPTRAGSPPPVLTRPTKVETPPTSKGGLTGLFGDLVGGAKSKWDEAIAPKTKPASTPNTTPKGGQGEKTTHGEGKKRQRNRGGNKGGKGN